jgi:hypothetical protein
VVHSQKIGYDYPGISWCDWASGCYTKSRVMKIAGIISGFALALVLASVGADSAPEPFFEGLGSHTRKISTDSPEAQKYFDQGLNFLFGFNHAAAIRAFQAAEKG